MDHLTKTDNIVHYYLGCRWIWCHFTCHSQTGLRP